MSDHQSPQTEEGSGSLSDPSESPEVPLQADIFGVKIGAKARPSPDLEPEPDSWTEVRAAVNKHLMSFVTHFFGGLADAFKAYRSLVRGLGALTGALAERIGRAHEQADR